MRTRLEFDLFQTDGSVGFNLTHLWGKLGNFGAGQTFSVFMDIDAFPNILDFWGPNSFVFSRQPQVRYTIPLGEQSRFTVSLEDPESNITLPSGIEASGRERFPDVAAHYRREGEWGHLQVAALLREISAESDVGTGRDAEDFGWGLNFTGSLNFDNGDRIVAQVAFGEGFARYMNDPCCSTVGGNDAAVNKKGELEAIDIAGGFLYYDHRWSSRFRSSIGASYAKIDPLLGQVGEAYANSLYASANLIWYPADPLKVGFEIVHGEVEDKLGRSNNNTRFQGSFSFKF